MIELSGRKKKIMAHMDNDGEVKGDVVRKGFALNKIKYI